MSYQVLARKYRPKSFETLVGQEHVVRALTHALGTGRLHHAYLFTGTRGVGKTTLSRILAKSLNCTGPDGNGGVTATPCGVCEACTAIDAGRFVDYIEMDAASNRGVDEMAQLLEQAIYAPSNARFKVYMIDEVHMLTNHAFNAMLKTLEEPPPHIKFILATTDPQKIPVTVLSRCLQFNLKQMPPGHIIGHLENILAQEGISFEQPALRLLAQGAHGSMRDALSLTDQAIAYAAGQVTLDAVQGMLGALDQSYLVRLLDALANQDGADLMAVADEMASRSLSYNGALQDLGTLLHRIALAQSVPSALPEDLPELADIRRLAQSFDAQEVQLFYQIAVHGRNEIGLAPDEYAGFTMTLLRMLAFRPGQGGAEISGAGGQGNVQRPAPVARPAAAAAAAVAPRVAAAPAVAPVREEAPAPRPAAVQPAPVASAPAPAAPAPASAAPASAAPSGAAPMTTARAAINAALEAARAAANRGGGARASASAPAAPAREATPSAPSAQTSPQPAALAAPQPQAIATPQPQAIATPQPQPVATPQPQVVAPPQASAALYQEAAPAAARAPLPWESAPQQQEEEFQDVLTEEDGPPDWVTESYDASEAGSEPAPLAPPAARQTARPPEPYVITPVAELGWDGNWPALAASLPLRGVAQQLALQTQLIECRPIGDAFTIKLKVPVDTLRASGNTEKLAAALQEHFAGKRVNVEIEIGPVWYTASAEAQAAREERQRQAEETVNTDPFVQMLVREFGATVVPGSVRPPAV
jgi:DNA polymerase-3 subunit gamma/tau